MSVRSLIGQIPHIAGCVDADRFAERNVTVFDMDKEKKVNTFDYRESDKKGNRLAVLEIPLSQIKDTRVYKAGMDRLRICMLSCDKKKKRITPEQVAELDELVVAYTNSPISPDPIDEHLTLEAATRGVWNP